MRTIKCFNERNVTLLKSLSLLLFLFHCDFNQCLVFPIETQTCLFTMGAEAPEVRLMSGFSCRTFWRLPWNVLFRFLAHFSVSCYFVAFCLQNLLWNVKCWHVGRSGLFIAKDASSSDFTCMILVQSGSVRLSHDATERNLLTVLLVF